MFCPGPIGECMKAWDMSKLARIISRRAAIPNRIITLSQLGVGLEKPSCFALLKPVLPPAMSFATILDLTASPF